MIGGSISLESLDMGAVAVIKKITNTDKDAMRKLYLNVDAGIAIQYAQAQAFFMTRNQLPENRLLKFSLVYPRRVSIPSNLTISAMVSIS